MDGKLLRGSIRSKGVLQLNGFGRIFVEGRLACLDIKGQGGGI